MDDDNLEEGLNPQQETGEDLSPEEFKQLMDLEKIRLRNEAIKNYLFGILIAFLLCGIFWIMVGATN